MMAVLACGEPAPSEAGMEEDADDTEACAGSSWGCVTAGEVEGECGASTGWISLEVAGSLFAVRLGRLGLLLVGLATDCLAAFCGELTDDGEAGALQVSL